MINKNIYFVGYFLEIEAKMKFTNLFKSKSQYFLECSDAKVNNSKLARYFPKMLYSVSKKNTLKIFDSKIEINSLTKNMYRRDLVNFNISQNKKVSMSRKRKIKLLIVAFILNFIKLKGRSSSNVLNLFKIFIKSFRSLPRGENQLKQLDSLFFKLRFIAGYKYTRSLLNKIKPSKDDIFIIWGKEYSSDIYLIDYLDKSDATYFIVEYGEIPGTISCNKDGIFGKSYPALNWNEFNSISIDNDDIEYAKNVLSQVEMNQVSVKNYDSNILFLMKFFYNNSLKKEKEDRQKIIYVNGVELLASGLLFKNIIDDVSLENPNQRLLHKVVSYFKDSNYLIIYKDHPMTYKSTPTMVIQKADFPTVNFVSDLNIHDVLSMSDIVISYPSKVIVTSLMYKVPTFVIGRFTIPNSIPSIKYYTSNKFEDIEELFTDNVEENETDYIQFITRLIKSRLLIYDEELFYKYNFENEQNKLESILNLHSLSRNENYENL